MLRWREIYYKENKTKGMRRITTFRPTTDRIYDSDPIRLRYYNIILQYYNTDVCRSQWPRGLKRRSAAARLLKLWVRIPPVAWMSVCCECCVLSGRGLCDELITRPEESYRLWCVVVCDLETSWMRRPWPTGGLLRQQKKKNLCVTIAYSIQYSNMLYRVVA